ncbi:winged helix-turn-helix domain-containing protein [Prauserella marina]
MLPILGYTVDGNVHSWRLIRDHCAEQFGATDEELADRLDSGGGRFDSRVQWAITHLVQAGLLDRPRRSHVRLTQRAATFSPTTRRESTCSCSPSSSSIRTSVPGRWATRSERTVKLARRPAPRSPRVNTHWKQSPERQGRTTRHSPTNCSDEFSRRNPPFWSGLS